MTDPGYNLVEIVDAVRRAGNPQKAAMDALADTDGLTDAVLLDALGVEQWGDLPTTPYPAAPGREKADRPAAKPRKKPGPKPGARRRKAAAAVTQAAGAQTAGAQKTEPKPVSVVRLADLDILREDLGRTANMLDEFSYAWSGILTDPKGPFSEEQVEAFGTFCETASVFLNGWDAARRRME